MDTNKIKKVRIPKDSLPTVNPGDAYYVRFRIRSNDDNMKSHWSWVYPVASELGKWNILDGGEEQ